MYANNNNNMITRPNIFKACYLILKLVATAKLYGLDRIQNKSKRPSEITKYISYLPHCTAQASTSSEAILATFR